MDSYQKNPEYLFKELSSSPSGLSSTEAQKRLQKNGLNILEKTRTISKTSLFLKQFANFIVLILLLATLISLLLGKILDGLVILFLLLLNAFLGFIQEYKAEQALEALRKLSHPKSLVLRDGNTLEVDTSTLVAGDILLLEEGASINADCRLLDASELNVDESSLTGESTPVEKNILVLKKKLPLSSQTNMVFAGTKVVNGRGRALVVATGLKTELGKIASQLQELTEEETPLQKQLSSLGKILSFIILILCGIVFALSFLETKQLLPSFLNSVALAVAAIPEGLPAIITITLTLGTRRLLKKNALVRKLYAVETLGATSVICVDKTGTLTKNEMQVLQLYTENKLIDVHTDTFYHEGKKIHPDPHLFQAALACNNASLNGFGDPTEKALLLNEKKANFSFNFKRIKEIPFSSEKKFMATTDKTSDGIFIHYKGAPETILSFCTHDNEGKLSVKKKQLLLKKAETMAANSLRTLAFAFASEKQPHKIIFLGFMGLQDPLREGVREAISVCKQAGIRVIMITGDHALTAQTIAKQAGIEGKTLTGEELDKLSDLQLKKISPFVNIYARVTAQHKLRILESLQDNQIVAMTGDGVNDALALKKANIGIAVGSGTDVAKEASNLILTDDNFVTIVEAIKQGRGIYSNLRKFIFYLLSCNFAEIAILLGALLLRFPLPFIALQLLWINLLTDGLPALALGIDPASQEIMHAPPRNPKEKILSKKNILFLFIQTLILTGLTLALYSFELTRGTLIHAQTLAFTFLILSELFIALTYHLDKNSFFSKRLFTNPYLWLALLSSSLLQLLPLSFFPNLFHTTLLVFSDFEILILFLLPLLLFHETSRKLNTL